ncbi:MAG: BREX system ATP-binding domain-containing protein [Phycisphaeraceae bacterium]
MSRSEPGAAALLEVGTGEYIDHFEQEVFSDIVAQGGSTCRFYEGPYGHGKTHLLELLRERALSVGFGVARIDLSSDLGFHDWGSEGRGASPSSRTGSDRCRHRAVIRIQCRRPLRHPPSSEPTPVSSTIRDTPICSLFHRKFRFVYRDDAETGSSGTSNLRFVPNLFAVVSRTAPG